MAKLYWYQDAVDSNWSSAENWTTTDGVAGFDGPPTAADDVEFTENSVGSCTVDAGAVCKSLDYGTNTLFSGAFDQNGATLTVSGNVTIVDNASTTWNGVLAMNATGVLTTDMNIDDLTVNSGAAVTLAQTTTIGGDLIVSGSGSSVCSSGFNLTVSGAATVTAPALLMQNAGDTVTVTGALTGVITDAVDCVPVAAAAVSPQGSQPRYYGWISR